MEPKIVFVEAKLKEAFDNLKTKDPRLHKEIEKAFEDIKQNMHCGRNVKKNLIPKNLIEKYEINN